MKLIKVTESVNNLTKARSQNISGKFASIRIVKKKT